MDQATLVGFEIEDAPRLIAEIRRDNLDVKAAFWLYTSESDNWYLYIATDAVDRVGPLEAYKAVIQARRRLPDLRIGRFQVKLVSPKAPLAKAILDYISQRRGPLPTVIRGMNLGGVSVEQAIVCDV